MKDQDVDNLIKMRLRELHSDRYLIQPSRDFASRTMEKVRKVDKQHRFWTHVWIVVASLAPFVVRETWLFVRGDYFSVSNLPLVGGLVVTAYSFFMSPVAMYLLLSGGIIASILYIFKFRRSYNSFARWA